MFYTYSQKISSPIRTRTGVSGFKVPYPWPLDYGAVRLDYSGKILKIDDLRYIYNSIQPYL